MIFLIEYDRPSGKLVQLTKYAAAESAIANRDRLALELERMHSGVEHEIVILDATSEDQLRRTHRRYFETLNSLADPDSPIHTRKAA